MNVPRLAIASARPVLRRGALAASVPRVALRKSSSHSHSSDSSTKSSDAPWAITSLIVFGSLFIYVTSPASKTHNEHGQVTGAKTPTSHGTGSSISDIKTEDDAVWKREDGHEASEHPYEPEHDENTPEGDKLLKAHRDNHKSEASSKSPTIKERDPSHSTVGVENSNFHSGIAHARDGDPVTDPKKVVAAADTAKQEKKAEKEAQAEASKKSEKDEGEETIEENEDAE